MNFCSLAIFSRSRVCPSASGGRRVAALLRRRLGVVGVRLVAVDGEEAGALHHLAGGAEQVAAALDVGLGDVEHRGQHLGGDEAVPDQLVELQLVALQVGGGALGREIEGGGPDRLVGVLGALLRAVEVGFRRERALAVGLGDHRPHLVEGLLRHPRRVGAHVGDQAHRAAVADLPSFVEPLGEGHGALDREAEPARRLLLQAAGDEGRPGALLRLLALDPGDPETAPLEVGDDAARLLAIVYLGLLAVDLGQPGVERRRLAGREVGADQPVLLGLEGVDLGLPVADHLQRHRLHAAGGEALLDLLPQQRRQLEAHQPVEDPPRLLGVDLLVIDGARLGQGRQHRPLGDLVEGDPPHRLGVASEQLGDVPGDGLALAIRVGGEVDEGGALGRFLQLGDDLALLLEHLVAGLEARADAQVFLHQVADVAHRRLDGIAAAEELLERPGLGGTLDDDQVFAHGGLERSRGQLHSWRWSLRGGRVTLAHGRRAVRGSGGPIRPAPVRAARRGRGRPRRRRGPPALRASAGSRAPGRRAAGP